jgi:hypothetical protein
MVGLDGADGATLDQLSLDGSLPNLARLRARGATRRLVSPDGVTDDGFWASFQYASGLGEHGRYHYATRQPGARRFSMVHLHERERRRFWDGLSDAGWRVAILDVPKCAPPRPINGVHLADWLVHGRYFEQPLSYPESFAADVLERFGASSAVCCDDRGPSVCATKAATLARGLADSADRKLAAGLDLLISEAWDLFVIGFKEAHCGGHAFTGVDGEDGADRPAIQSAAMVEILRRLDAAIGDLVAAAGPDASVVVFSTTEMGRNSTLQHLTADVVRRVNAVVGGTWLSRLPHRLRKHLPWVPFRQPCEILPYSENCTALRINAPAHSLLGWSTAARDRLADEIAGLFGELVDDATGQGVVACIDRPSAELPGSRAAALPDLLIRYHREITPRAVSSPRLGRFEGDPPPMRPGNHGAGRSFCVLAGPAAGEEVGAVQDLGPLAARLLGAQPPLARRIA